MPTVKLGSTSHTATNDLLMKHFEIDNKIHEQLAAIDYETKIALSQRLPGFIDEINAERKMKTEVL